MLNQHHPDDERLSALASRDDATADAALASHVESCARCTDLVTELGALRASLSDLPDLRPTRPLQLLPPEADEQAATGAGGWIRRLFAPALTAGAAIAMVGLIGTAAPVFDGMAASGGGAAAAEETALGAAESMGVEAPADGFQRGDSDSGTAEPSVATAGGEGEGSTNGGESEGGVSRFETYDDQLPAERSPWPMVLFTGVALMICAALLRWILVPRAG